LRPGLHEPAGRKKGRVIRGERARKRSCGRPGEEEKNRPPYEKKLASLNLSPLEGMAQGGKKLFLNE